MSMKLVKNCIARDDEMKHEEENIIKQFDKTTAEIVHHYHKSLPSKIYLDKMFNNKNDYAFLNKRLPAHATGGPGSVGTEGRTE